MNANGPQLRDIHLPQVSWWPPAIGWWLLAVLVVSAILVGVWIWLRGRIARSARRAAERELDTLVARHARDRSDIMLAAGLSRLLRRIALVLQPDIAAHQGSAWREFLASRGQAAFTDEQLDALIDAPYRAHATFNADALVAATRRWCENALRRRAMIARDLS
jgi:hypothetical protein